jgi:hypothetical protein
MKKQNMLRAYWTLALTLLFGLGLAFALISLAQARDGATPSGVHTPAGNTTTANPEARYYPEAVSPSKGIASFPSSTDTWWAGVHAHLHRENYNLPLVTSPSWTATGENIGDSLGYSVASVGDVNGDGYDDAIVGALGYPSGSYQGRVYVYHGSDAGLMATPALTLTGENNGDWFGVSVASAGDVNGDGYADAIIGAYGYSSGDWKGRVYVYHGSGAGLVATPALTLTGENNGDWFGVSVASVGDVNGDGYADAIVGAFASPNGDWKGRVYVYHGSDVGLVATPAITLTGENSFDSFGGSVASAGDVNGDGYADAIVGAYGYSSQGDRGRVYVYHGSGAGLKATPALTLTGENNGDWFGASVASVGDVNGDGYADAIIGAYGYPSGGIQGRVYVYHGSDVGLVATPALTLTGENDGDRFGYSVANAGDVNGDGYADAIVGSVGYASGRRQGRVYVYHGSGAGLVATPALDFAGENNDDLFGWSVASAGDVNGDGYADAIVGAPFYPNDSGQGRAYVYHSETEYCVWLPIITKNYQP